jgi:DNA-binding FrmR family transcriptional regulator
MAAHTVTPGAQPPKAVDMRTATADEQIAAELVIRLRKIEGQMRGLQHMVERGDHCRDVLTQIAATRAALTAVGRMVLACEIRRAIDEGPSRVEQALDELLGALDLLAGR